MELNSSQKKRKQRLNASIPDFTLGNKFFKKESSGKKSSMKLDLPSAPTLADTDLSTNRTTEIKTTPRFNGSAVTTNCSRRQESQIPSDLLLELPLS